MLPQHHDARRNHPALDPPPNGPNDSHIPSFRPPFSGGEGLAGSDLLRLHRKHSKQWTDKFRKAIGVKGRNDHGSSIVHLRLERLDNADNWQARKVLLLLTGL